MVGGGVVYSRFPPRTHPLPCSSWHPLALALPRMASLPAPQGCGVGPPSLLLADCPHPTPTPKLSAQPRLSSAFCGDHRAPGCLETTPLLTDQTSSPAIPSPHAPRKCSQGTAPDDIACTRHSGGSVREATPGPSVQGRGAEGRLVARGRTWPF